MDKSQVLEIITEQHSISNVVEVAVNKALSDAFEAGRQSLAEQLQKELINLPVDKNLAADNATAFDGDFCYRVGHRDARHAAVDKVLQLVANT